MHIEPLGKTGLSVPQIVYGASSLGNLYEALSPETKLTICRAWFEATDTRPVGIDMAGKYGAGLALEVVGDSLRQLGVAPQDVVISNKLGWKRVPLLTPEPTFEQGVWMDLENDAEQCIGYNGILECWRQGCELLGEPYRPQMVSVHDPDEYLADATSPEDRDRRLEDIGQAYKALFELKDQGEVLAVGVGSKDWRVIEELSAKIDFDWVMLANSLTIYRHPPQLLAFLKLLSSRGVGVINSAVFQAGFLVGGGHLDYRLVTPADNPEAFSWREKFNELCARYGLTPAAVCVRFGLAPPGVSAIALNTSSPLRVLNNVELLSAVIPAEFWREAKLAGLISPDCDFVG